jgi:hypothetical protein
MRESSPTWAAAHLSEYIPVQWVRSVSKFIGRSTNYQEISFGSGENVIAFRLPTETPIAQLIDAIAESKPVHPGWLPYLLVHPFAVDPSPVTLAVTLDAFAESSTLEHARDAKLPWPLLVILDSVKEPADLLPYSVRARGGDLGDVNVWAAAEQRWREFGCEILDWTVFTDIEAPFDRTIAERGVVAIGYSLRHSEHGVRQSVVSLKEALSGALSRYARRTLADALLFCLEVQGDGYSEPVLFSIRELAEIASIAKWDFDASAFRAVYDSEELAPLRAQLEVIGARINIPTPRYEETIDFDDADRISSAARQIANMLTSTEPSQGLVRLLAGLTTLGAKCPPLSIDLAKLGTQGDVARIAFSLFAEGVVQVTPGEVADSFLRVCEHDTPSREKTEVKQMIRQSAAPPISDFATSVLDVLLRTHRVDRDLAKQIVEGFLSSTRFRTTTLGSREVRIELAL